MSQQTACLQGSMCEASQSHENAKRESPHCLSSAHTSPIDTQHQPSVDSPTACAGLQCADACSALTPTLPLALPLSRPATGGGTQWALLLDSCHYMPHPTPQGTHHPRFLHHVPDTRRNPQPHPAMGVHHNSRQTPRWQCPHPARPQPSPGCKIVSTRPSVAGITSTRQTHRRRCRPPACPTGTAG